MDTIGVKLDADLFRDLVFQAADYVMYAENPKLAEKIADVALSDARSMGIVAEES